MLIALPCGALAAAGEKDVEKTVEKTVASPTESSAAPQVLTGSPAPDAKAAVVTPETNAVVPAAHDKPSDPSPKTETPGQPSTKPDHATAKEPIKSIHRPTTPPTPPDRDELKVRPNGDGKIRLRFNGQSWQPVLEWLATISGMSLDWQELPGDYLNLSTRRSYTVPEVRDLINRHLLARGFTLLCRGEVMTVAEIKKLDPSLVPRVDRADLSQRDPHEYVKVSFPLVSLLAESAVDELKPMLSPNGRLTPMNETNRLEAMDAVTNLRDIDAVLQQQQAEESQPRSFREFKLKHVRAEEVHSLLATLLGSESKSAAAQGGQPGNISAEQAAMLARAQGGGGGASGQQPSNGNPPGPKAATTLAVNVRNNSLLVHARCDKMLIIAQVIDAVDIPVDRNGSLLVNMNRMQVYRLSGIDPEPVVKTLEEIGNLDPTTRLEVDKKNSSIIVYASLADHVTIRALVDKLSGSERKFEVIRLRRLAADYVAGTIDFMLGSGAKKEKSRTNYWNPYDQPRPDNANAPRSFRVDADVEHNRLLLWANPVELTEVEALLVKLGEIPSGGSGSATVRTIDGGDEKETEELIERIRQAWPSIAPNPLLIPKAPAPTAPNTNSPLPHAGDTRPTPASPLPSAGAMLGVRGSALQPPPTTDRTQPPLLHLANLQSRSADMGPAESLPANKGPVDSPPPIKISIGPDGKMIVSSEDTQALDRLEELAAQLPNNRKDYQVFRLKYAWAVGVSLNLEDFFKEDKKERPRPSRWMFYDYGADSQDDSEDERKLSKRRKLKFISDADTNTILVEGADAKQLKTIEDLIKLYDQPPPSDSQSVRKTEVIRLKYSKARAVVDTVKDVYRDLLSSNDKALATNNQQKESSRSIIFNYDTDKTEQKTPKFKGLLSIGVDETSNSLMVSAPAYLFDHVAKMIKELDQAAAPDYTVRMVRVGPGLSANRVKEILDEVYNQKSSEKRPVEKRPSAKTSKPGKATHRANQAKEKQQPEADGSSPSETESP